VFRKYNFLFRTHGKYSKKWIAGVEMKDVVFSKQGIRLEIFPDCRVVPINKIQKMKIDFHPPELLNEIPPCPLANHDADVDSAAMGLCARKVMDKFSIPPKLRTRLWENLHGTFRQDSAGCQAEWETTLLFSSSLHKTEPVPKGHWELMRHVWNKNNRFSRCCRLKYFLLGKRIISDNKTLCGYIPYVRQDKAMFFDIAVERSKET
jgi:hypothetical protein